MPNRPPPTIQDYDELHARIPSAEKAPLLLPDAESHAEYARQMRGSDQNPLTPRSGDGGLTPRSGSSSPSRTPSRNAPNPDQDRGRKCTGLQPADNLSRDGMRPVHDEALRGKKQVADYMHHKDGGVFDDAYADGGDGTPRAIGHGKKHGIAPADHYGVGGEEGQWRIQQGLHGRQPGEMFGEDGLLGRERSWLIGNGDRFQVGVSVVVGSALSMSPCCTVHVTMSDAQCPVGYAFVLTEIQDSCTRNWSNVGGEAVH